VKIRDLALPKERWDGLPHCGGHAVIVDEDGNVWVPREHANILDRRVAGYVAAAED
jgi:hypothetical protein